MTLEGIAQKIQKKMQQEGKVSYCNFETPEYIEKIKFLKDNWKSELKEKGISVSFNYAKYPIDIY